MIEMPIQFQDCSTIKTRTKDAIVIRLLCQCNCSKFYLLKNILNFEDEGRIKAYEKRLGTWHRIENYTDPTTQTRYLVTRSFSGRIRDKIPISEVSQMRRTQIVKSKCCQCGKEKIIFDSRYHGYDGYVNGEDLISSEKEYQYLPIIHDAMEVEIKLRYDLSYNEYCKETGGTNLTDFTNSFSSIEIYGIINGNKKKIFEEETA